MCKTKKQYYSNFKVSKVVDKKVLENREGFLFQQVNLETVTPVKDNMVISVDQKIVDIFTEYFDTIVPKLGLAILKDLIIATNCKEKILF